MNSGVYLILNTKNNHKYVGSSVNLSRRERIHFHKLNKQTHENTHLQRAWNKYGEDAFDLHALALCAREKKSLLALEQHFIDLLLPEYNILPIAGSPIGYIHTKESRTKMSNAGKGRKHTVEHNAKISVANKGRKHTPEAKANMSAAGMRRPPPSAETKAKLSAALKGRKVTDEHKAKISESLKGHKPTKETRRKLSAANKGKPWTPARRAAQEDRKERR